MQSCDCQSEETISYASGWRALGTASRNGKKLSTRVRVYTIRVNYTGTLCIKVIVFYCNMTTNSSYVFLQGDFGVVAKQTLFSLQINCRNLIGI